MNYIKGNKIRIWFQNKHKTEYRDCNAYNFSLYISLCLFYYEMHMSRQLDKYKNNTPDLVSYAQSFVKRKNHWSMLNFNASFLKSDYLFSVINQREKLL